MRVATNRFATITTSLILTGNMPWLTQNRISASIIVLLTILLVWSVFTRNEEPQATQFDKEVALESVYKNSLNLPRHNTACFPERRVFCNRNECVSIEPKTFNLISGASASSSHLPTVSRCDDKGCDTYDSQFEPSGNYVNVQPIAPKGMLFKMSLSDSKFVEFVTLGLDSYVTFGYCVSRTEPR